MTSVLYKLFSRRPGSIFLSLASVVDFVPYGLRKLCVGRKPWTYGVWCLYRCLHRCMLYLTIVRVLKSSVVGNSYLGFDGLCKSFLNAGAGARKEVGFLRRRD